MKPRGKVHKFGPNVDTDVMLPARYLDLSDPKELAKHCMEDIDKNFAKNVQHGDIIVAERNFGSGSAREHAPISIKASGVSAIIAKSFARIFYRNALNIGLPVLESEEAVDALDQGDIVEIDLPVGKIVNITKGTEFKAKPYPEFIMQLILMGGLVEHTKWRISNLNPEKVDDSV